MEDWIARAIKSANDYTIDSKWVEWEVTESIKLGKPVVAFIQALTHLDFARLDKRA